MASNLEIAISRAQQTLIPYCTINFESNFFYQSESLCCLPVYVILGFSYIFFCLLRKFGYKFWNKIWLITNKWWGKKKSVPHEFRKYYFKQVWAAWTCPISIFYINFMLKYLLLTCFHYFSTFLIFLLSLLTENCTF